MNDELLKPVPFQEAIDVLKGKGVVASDVFRSLSPELKARAFTISGLEGAAGVMQAVRDRIADLPAGANWDEVKRDIASDISPFLVDDDAEPEECDRQILAAARRAELLMRIHGFQSYMAAQHEVLDRQKDVFPAWQYKTVGDDRVRDSHAALNDLVLPADSPFWEDHYPPWDWGCRCDVIPLMQEDIDQIKAEDAKRNPEDRLVLEGKRLEGLEQGGSLIRGPVKFFEPNDPERKQVSHILPGKNHYLAAPVNQGKEGAFSWNPRTMKMPVEDLAKRYDPKVWDAFQKWAKEQPAGDDKAAPTIWEWLNSKSKATAPRPRQMKLPLPAAPTLPTAPPPASVPQAPRDEPAKPLAPVPAKGGSPIRKVTDALAVNAKGDVKQKIQGALSAINKVHDVDRLPSIPVNTHAKGDLGKFVHYKDGGAPLKISIRENGPWPGMSTAHEVGHFLDYTILGGKNKFASPGSGLLAEWRKAIDSSNAFTRIRSARMPEKNRKYFLSNEEAFARSYAQYVARKSGDPGLLKDLDRIRGGVEYWRQWEDADFAPIEAALEKIFQSKGWL